MYENEIANENTVCICIMYNDTFILILFQILLSDMYDISYIRKNQVIFDLEMRKRGVEVDLSSKIIEIDDQRKTYERKMQELQAEKNILVKKISIMKSNGEDCNSIFRETEILEKQIQSIKMDHLNNKVEIRLKSLIASLPNMSHESVPEGSNEDDNIEILKYGDMRNFDFTIKEHVEFQGIDFSTATTMSGSRFVLLHNEFALLERALANFMLDVHITEHGYIEYSTPYLVKESAMFGVGQLPKFAEESFLVEGQYRLIPTSEVTLTNIVANKIVDIQELPLRFTAHTPCFRSEAGSAGKDTKGMIRLHQFSKVELVSIVTQEHSLEELERLTNCAENILKKLNLHYRKILLCKGDMGFSSGKTYDLEVWLPYSKKYREISSCSNCFDFQARRMNSKYKTHDNKKFFVHTLNGSGLAIGRTMVAIIENYQNQDGSISIPDVLIPYMRGKKKILNKC